MIKTKSRILREMSGHLIKRDLLMLGRLLTELIFIATYPKMNLCFIKYAKPIFFTSFLKYREECNFLKLKRVDILL